MAERTENAGERVSLLEAISATIARPLGIADQLDEQLLVIKNEIAQAVGFPLVELIAFDRGRRDGRLGVELGQLAPEPY